MDIKEILRSTTCLTYDVIDSLLGQLCEGTDEEKERVIRHIAWHIPTGGPKMTINGEDGKLLKKEDILKEIRSQYIGGEEEEKEPEKEIEKKPEEILEEVIDSKESPEDEEEEPEETPESTIEVEP